MFHIWTRNRFIPLALGLLTALSCAAGPFVDLKVPFTQPDGTTIEVIGSGDEFHAVFETTEGYTVIFDPTLRAYCYARQAADGRLVSTGIQAHLINPAAVGLQKHLRMGKEARKQQVFKRYQRWEQGMQIETEWRNKKAAMRQYEAQAKQDGPLPSPPPFTTTGVKIGLTLLVDFDDDPGTIPQAEVVNFCNGDSYTGFGNNGSVKKYFRDNSNNLLTYSNIVTVYVRIPNTLHPKSYYNDTSKDCGDQGNELIRDAILILKALPNYTTEILPAFSALTVDSNNRVVACNVFYAGGNGGVWNYGLWPHSWSLYNVGQQELSPGGKKVYKYQITNMGTSLTLGTFCHENGHMLCGFPDIYDYDSDSKGGAGRFCLMNSGGSGTNPTQINAYLKRAAGWATTVEVDSSTTTNASLVATPGSGFNKFYRFRRAGINTEYFLLEARYTTGRDSGIPGSGVAIWHIDELGNHNNQSMTPNSSHQNYEVTLVQADNLWHFQNNVNSGDAQDLYYSGNPAASYSNDFSDGSNPNAQWWDGTPSGASFHDFSARATTMTFSIGYSNTAPQIVSEPQDRTVIAFRTTTFGVGVTGSAPMTYQWFFDGASIPGATSNSYSIPSVTTAHAGNYHVTVTNTFGGAVSRTAYLTVLPGVSLAEGLDAPSLTWTTGGDALWEGQVDVTHDGTDATHSGTPGDQQLSWLETTVSGPGTLSFWWKVSSEVDYDFLEFLIDNAVQSGRISGSPAWQQRTFNISSGSHTLRWRYSKDQSVVSGQDKGYVDQVTWTPTGSSAPSIVAQPQSLNVVAGYPASFTVSATGSAPLAYQWSFNGTPMAGATLSQYAVASASNNEAGAYRVVITNTLGSVTSVVALLTVTPAIDLAAALDTPALAWTTGGAAQWVGQQTASHDGVDAAKSGSITNLEETLMETTLASGPGKLSFWWSVSSETNWDYLEFHLDSVLQQRISGTVAWRQEFFDIPAGRHELRWRYTKDMSVSAGQDAGWVDQVSFVPDIVEAPTISSLRVTNQEVVFEVFAANFASCVVLGTTNLLDWVSLQTNAAPFTFRDPEAALLPRRFYRVRSEP